MIHDAQASDVDGSQAVVVETQSDNGVVVSPVRRDWWADLVQAEFPGHDDLADAMATQAGRLDAGVEAVASPGRAATPEVDVMDLDVPNSSDDDGGRSVQEELEAEVCLPLCTPILRGGPSPRRSRTPVTVNALRRSRQIAAKPRAANATTQAQLVLLRKLGIHVDANAVDSDIACRFKAAFGGGMSDEKKKIMQTLLNGDFDLASLGLDLAGLEDEVA